MVYGVRLKSLLRYNRLKPTQRAQMGRIVWMQGKRPRNYPIEYQPVNKKPVEPTILTPDPQPTPDSVQAPVQAYASPPAPKPDLTDSLFSQLTDSAATTPVDTDDIELPAVLKIHSVKAGQTYFSISRLYGITVAQLYAWNNLSAKKPLLVGQELIIDTVTPAPVPRRRPQAIVKTVPKKVAVPAVKAANGLPYYVVKTGETIYRIALNNGISVSDLMKLNGLTSYIIEVGQRLLIRPKN